VSDPDDLVFITRLASGEVVDGVPRPFRVYITGPHFGTDVYSSTDDRDRATVFSRRDAERLIARGMWHTRAPRIETLH
jgi:hypothetical protein